MAKNSQDSNPSKIETEVQDRVAKNFFTNFLMCLDIGSLNYKNHPYFTSLKDKSLEEIIPPSVTPQDSRCKIPESYPEGRQPYQLQEEWEYLDEITPAEEDIIKNTWRLMRRDLRTNGHLIFIRFLNEYPKYKPHLSSSLEEESDIETCQQLSDLGFAIMNLLDRIITNLSRPKICTDLLSTEGLNYAKHKLHIRHFLDFQKSMLLIMKEMIGCKFTTNVENTWKKFLTIIMGIMEDASHWNDFGYR